MNMENIVGNHVKRERGQFYIIMQDMNICEECKQETNNTMNGLCKKCFEQEERKGNIIALYPKVYSFDGMDSVVTKWDIERTKRWYENLTGSDTNEMSIEEIDIEKECYWDCDNITELDRMILNSIDGTEYTEIKKIGSRNTYGDLRNLWGEYYKYTSYKDGILDKYMNIKEPEIMASTEY